MMKPIRRPKPDETDEDLIRQNEEFLNQLRLQDKNTTTETRTEASGHEASPGKTNRRPTIEEILERYSIKPEGTEADQEEEKEKDAQREDLVNEELEATVDNFQKGQYFSFLQVKEKDPIAPLTSKAPSSRRKTSQFAKSRPKPHTDKPAVDTRLTSTASLGTNEPVGDKIHPLLAGMTEAEILEEQQRLIQKMDPKLVEFVRSMKHRKRPDTVAELPPPSPIKQIKTETDQIAVKDLPINPDEVKNLPHMNKVESNKLLWTLPAKSEKSQTDAGSKVEERNARFDFQGKLLTEDDDKDSRTWLKGLHNHGDEMQRPGYTLDELLTLARSTNSGQRAAALDTFSEILRNAHDGMFDFMLGKSVLDLCLEMDWIYVVRKGLDHNDALTINAALNCLSALLFPEREEMCLDSVLTWDDSEIGPCIIPEKEDATDLAEKLQQIQSTNEEKNDDKDFQIARGDLIEFFLHRGCLLDRLEYLLDSRNEYLTTFGVINMLKILIRISRHSPEYLIEQEKILDYFAMHHLQLNTISVSESKHIQKMEGVPSILFLKTLRILISSSKSNASAVMRKYEVPIFTSIEQNLSCSDTLLHAIPQIELLIQQTIFLWMHSASAGHGVDRFFAFAPITMKFFNLYLAKPLLNIFDLNHSALIIALLLRCLRSVPTSSLEQYIRQYASIIEQLVLKTCNILAATHLEDHVDLDSSFAVLHQCLEFFIFARVKINYQAQCSAKIDQFLCTPAFDKATQRIRKSSILLCKPLKTEANFEEKYPKNLIFTEAVLFGGKLSPLLREGNFVFPFLTVLHRFANTIEMNNHRILVGQHVRDYLDKLIAAPIFYNEENYYLSFELCYLHELLQIIDRKAEDLKHVYTQLSYKLSSTPRIGSELLSKSFLQMFVRTFKEGLTGEEMSDLLNLYFQMIDMERNSKSTNAFRVWRTELLPTSWLVESLKAVYSSLETLYASDCPKDEEDAVSESNRQAQELKTKDAVLGFRIIVWRVLRFIRLCFSTSCLQNVIVQTKLQYVDYYSKICQVFLMSPTIFLYQPIRDNLQDIFTYFCSHKVLVTSKKSAVFTKLGKSNELVDSAFESFYSQLVTEFSNSSYGDEVFSAFILLPLRVQESKKLKLRFWTDVCVRFVRLEKENGRLPLSYFIGAPASPAAMESDPEVISMYGSLLRVGTCTAERTPFLYEVLRFNMKNGASNLDKVL